MATVDLNRVRKSYGAVEAIKGIDISVADGEFLVLLGPSGCGKSTLLRMVAGLESITGGEIAIGGRVVNGLEPKDRDIAMVFQNYALYPHMSVFDNMAYGLKIRGLPKADIQARVAKAAEILELNRFLDRRPSQLSGGQRQRVAMGRAIVREPAAFLFDEPLSNLDAKLRTQMRVEIKRLQDRLGITSLYVTHDQVEAMTLADRILVMNHGVAEQVGTPLEVYQRPASLFVAGFIGSPPMNILDARFDGAGQAVALPGGTTFALPRPRPDMAGRPVKLGVRPEHLAVTSGDGPLIVTVDLVEALGADTVVYGRLPDGEGMVVRVAGLPFCREGETLRVGAPSDALHLFDSESGRRLSD
ncbi:sn-glycerol-3-phosphate import ATP-binding protein UgpC [Azospirillum brasilense]|uniref:sn-glycerol-3-phosphate import ATP-binding protein UgpC n=1 Tax=Azospirillum brasilense TaxID=192 RepID=UPI000E6A64B0|nr:sn-glycerol-3-phosphate import ATP-binding protein UgpC [Azospirillum brasilense]NUB28259.1 sn-glycerol-3-phosphate ABC transporter ATP-binding protein UgpC [Azospirillum brasilense]NUB33007.1 sn-glycerol-3-phosphate ABC transporter ATP-binding protein UgpC [Azospirillum brasilense]RIW00461.1 sn-glycerol-3-phosphate import ATP-binding protein UgpC [Azospirillum brasilense]